jgi:L-alanine-DL-glutamate epimerase-like enolase superfamily enzyme
MKIKECRVRTIHIPFVTTFKHSLSSRSEVESIIVEVDTDTGAVGYGEAVPRDFVTGETVEGVREKLLKLIFPGIIGKSFNSFREIEEWITNLDKCVPGLQERDLCVKTGIELALLDAAGKEFNCSVVEFLGGGKAKEIIYSGIISAEQPSVVKKTLEMCKLASIREIKMKVGDDIIMDLENIKQARSLLGETASIRVDVNAAWDLATAKENLLKFMDLGVVAVEQPMPVASRDDYPFLNEFLAGRMDLCIDESLCTIADGLWMAEHRGATIFNLRISKNGGLINALRLYNIAKKAGIRCQLGAQVGETSLLSSAGRILAVVTGDLVFHEGSFGTLLLSFDLTRQPIGFSNAGIGTADVVTRERGLGVNVDQELLNKMTTSIHTIAS